MNRAYLHINLVVLRVISYYILFILNLLIEVTNEPKER